MARASTAVESSPAERHFLRLTVVVEGRFRAGPLNEPLSESAVSSHSLLIFIAPSHPHAVVTKLLCPHHEGAGPVTMSMICEAQLSRDGPPFSW